MPTYRIYRVNTLALDILDVGGLSGSLNCVPVNLDPDIHTIVLFEVSGSIVLDFDLGHNTFLNVAHGGNGKPLLGETGIINPTVASPSFSPCNYYFLGNSSQLGVQITGFKMLFVGCKNMEFHHLAFQVLPPRKHAGIGPAFPLLSAAELNTYTGIAVAGTATTIKFDAFAVPGNGYYDANPSSRPSNLVTALGQTRTITSYDTVTRIATIDPLGPVWSPIPVAGSSYSVPSVRDHLWYQHQVPAFTFSPYQIANSWDCFAVATFSQPEVDPDNPVIPYSDPSQKDYAIQDHKFFNCHFAGTTDDYDIGASSAGSSSTGNTNTYYELCIFSNTYKHRRLSSDTITDTNTHNDALLCKGSRNTIVANCVFAHSNRRSPQIGTFFNDTVYTGVTGTVVGCFIKDWGSSAIALHTAGRYQFVDNVFFPTGCDASPLPPISGQTNFEIDYRSQTKTEVYLSNNVLPLNEVDYPIGTTKPLYDWALYTNHNADRVTVVQRNSPFTDIPAHVDPTTPSGRAQLLNAVGTKFSDAWQDLVIAECATSPYPVGPVDPTYAGPVGPGLGQHWLDGEDDSLWPVAYKTLPTYAYNLTPITLPNLTGEALLAYLRAL